MKKQRLVAFGWFIMIVILSIICYFLFPFIFWMGVKKNGIFAIGVSALVVTTIMLIRLFIGIKRKYPGKTHKELEKLRIDEIPGFYGFMIAALLYFPILIGFISVDARGMYKSWGHCIIAHRGVHEPYIVYNRFGVKKFEVEWDYGVSIDCGFDEDGNKKIFATYQTKEEKHEGSGDWEYYEYVLSFYGAAYDSYGRLERKLDKEYEYITEYKEEYVEKENLGGEYYTLFRNGTYDKLYCDAERHARRSYIEYYGYTFDDPNTLNAPNSD